MPSRHRKLATAVALLATFTLFPGVVRAELIPSGFLCNVGTVFNPNFVACSGIWSGNNAGEPVLDAVLKQIQADFGGLYPELNSWTVDGNDLGTTNAGMTNYPFSSVPDGTAGTLVFSNPMTSVFVLILKGGDYFAMYLFDPVLLGESISAVQYTMNDFPTNPSGNPPGLSHASLWGDEGTTVPEPSSLLLLGSGLLGLGFVGYRRRRK